MYNTFFTNRATDDFDKIIFYISSKLSAPKAASDLIDNIYASIDLLEENPYIYEVCRDGKLKNEGYRRAVINNYVMIYKIYEEQKSVIIHGIFYGRQKYIDLL